MNILNKIINITLILFVSLIAIKLMDFNQTQAPAWVAPYLSAAANFDFSNLVMYIDQNQIEQFSKLTRADQFNFNFIASENIEKYEHLAVGFYFIVVIATKLFFFIGDLEAVQLLQQIVHIVLSLLLMSQIDINRNKALFFVLYMINPIVLYFVNFPYYYFWQVIPAVIFLYYYLNNKKVENTIFLLAILFFLLFMIRPTVLFFVIFFFLYIAIKEGWRKPLASLVLFFGLIYISPSHGFGPWHTMYVGIGAYENKYNIQLSDESGYKYFYEVKNKIFSSKDVMNKELKNEYYQSIKSRYLEILKQEPLIIVKNAILNILGAYAAGYKTGNMPLIYINILLGIIMVSLLLYTKQYILFLAIGAASISFTPYYPPISAYMYGSYILIVIGFIGILSYFIDKKNNSKGHL